MRFQLRQVIFALTLFFLMVIIGYVLRTYSLSEILKELKKISLFDFLVIVTLVTVNYLVLSLIDYVALKTVLRNNIKFKIAFSSSFVANSFSYNLGAPLVVGTFFRFRILSLAGISMKQILDAIILVSFHYWVALAVCFSMISLVTSILGYQSIFSPTISSVMTLVSTGGLVFYFFFLEKRRIFKIFNLKFLTPPRPVIQKILLVCILDWLTHYSVFYFCIPGHSVNYLELAVPFLLSQTVGLISHIPGGFGVFESVGFLTLKNIIKPEALIAGMIVYRLFMYFVPLLIAAVIYSLFELKAGKNRDSQF
ncbi:MAG: lysylphosphatidylglycerol synthase domain-containing protein [Deltaproteobacteria bacterium]|nr:lysylphosphatidylglycerol synthase domain-containing protein [Deltaproteobacteria bacterium]MCX7952733.1 lysylphosphatidylglycerol synthase domain-containing protein [Deltaproteobacteria bacterium]